MYTRVIMLLLAVPLILTGCSRQPESAIKINQIDFSPSEFEQAYQNSHYSIGGDDGREEFLENFISKKLILTEAERLGLDKDPDFLNDIQKFWEQGLMKLTLRQRSEQIASEVKVSDQEVRLYYDQFKEKQFSGKSLQDVYQQIHDVLKKGKQSQMLAEWVKELRKTSDVYVDYDALNLRAAK